MTEIQQFMALHGLLNGEAVIATRDWQTLREGVQISYLYQEPDGGPSAALLYYQPDARVPSHIHHGYEHIFILAGEQQDQNGVYETGSLLIHRPGSSHHIYSPRGCLALAVWNKPVTFPAPADT